MDMVLGVRLDQVSFKYSREKLAGRRALSVSKPVRICFLFLSFFLSLFSEVIGIIGLGKVGVFGFSPGQVRHKNYGWKSGQRRSFSASIPQVLISYVP